MLINIDNMDKVIRFNYGKAFSDEDIRRLCKYHVNVMTYRDLREYKSIDDALGEYNAIILLYETKKNYGHWVAIHKVDKNTIEFFDSYGIIPDHQIKNVDKRRLNELGYDDLHLTNMIKSAGYNLLYNDIKLQKLKDDMSTCGRWAGLRIACKQIPLKDFVKLFKKQKMEPDWYVTALTMYI